MFIQPAALFPAIAELSPLRNVAILALLAYIFSKKDTSESFFSDCTNRNLIYFILAQILSIALVWSVGAVSWANIWLLYVISYYLLVKLVNTQARIIAICLMIILPILYLSFYSLSSFVIDYKPGVRAVGVGWFDNPNDLACILVSTIPLCLLVSENYSNIIIRYIMIVSAGLLSFNVLFTASRGGILGLLFVCASGLFMSAKISKFLKIIITGLLVVAVVGIGLENVTDRGLEGNLTNDDSATDRIIQWHAGKRMILAHPFFGVGPDQFEDYAADYGGVPRLAPHNTIVLIFAETGIIGGYFFLIFAFKQLKNSIANLKQDYMDSGIKGDSLIATKYISIAIIGFWICAFFGNRDRDYILYILVALLVCANKIFQQSTRGLDIPPNSIL
jgi:O-antigen ligase